MSTAKYYRVLLGDDGKLRELPDRSEQSAAGKREPESVTIGDDGELCEPISGSYTGEARKYYWFISQPEVARKILQRILFGPTTIILIALVAMLRAGSWFACYPTAALALVVIVALMLYSDARHGEARQSKKQKRVRRI
jgi:hypothetical protein